MAKRGTKQGALQTILTEFAIEIGIPTLPNGKCDKARYNNAWTRMWRRIHRINLFQET